MCFHLSKMGAHGLSAGMVKVHGTKAGAIFLHDNVLVKDITFKHGCKVIIRRICRKFYLLGRIAGKNRLYAEAVQPGSVTD